jgi:hypothetical protein
MDQRELFDVTRELKACDALMRVHRGLYVQYFENDDGSAVHDRNGEHRGRGKMIVASGGASVKVGKFQNGFLARRAEDALHFHRRPAEGVTVPYSDEFIYAPENYVYLNCLKRVWLLDLGCPSPEQLKKAERQLIVRLNEHLGRSNVQDFRGEWRLLKRRPSPEWLSELAEWVSAEFVALKAYRVPVV